MSLQEILSNITAGGVVSVIVIILSLVEITPIKISPLEWIGNRVNKSIREEYNEMMKEVRERNAKTLEQMNSIEDKLDNHIAEEMRRDILDYQNTVLQGRRHTKEEWTYIYRLCDKYERHIEENNLDNSEAEEAIFYIRKVYRELLEKGEFIIKGEI